MRLVPAVLWLALCAASPAFAQTAPVAPAPASSVTNLESVVVSGVQPGPGLWKVSKGDHVMWVLGALSALPEHMQWKTDEVEQTIAASQEVLSAPSVNIKLKTNFFGKLFLLPTLIGARKNPDGVTLQQALPASEYARWEVLKQKYIGSDRDVESWRPMFAAIELYEKAIKRSGLKASGGVKDTVRELAKKHNVKVTSTRYEMVIEEPRAAMKTFKKSPMDDQQCFSQALDTVEHDLGSVTARANAWAVGDIEALRGLPLNDRRDACIEAVTGAGFAEKLGFKDLPQRVESTWMGEVDRALSSNAQTFALLPMEEVLSPTGYLAKLKAKGYVVQAPDEQDAAAP
ncbi:TraB/GumN family protein [Dyella subtropica]|uniref:TraB/GumN family protein n=1 Tax=Dyella subtropica TaxID=2992127 RepID=UPI002256C9A8|nr:TraB/GumN family protein [Dyella subtropica]